MSTIDAVLQEVDELEGDRTTTFFEFAKRIHAGEKPSASEAMEILRTTGRTKEDLRFLGDLFEDLDKARAITDEYHGLDVIDKEVRAKVEAANQVLEAAVAEHQRTTRPLQYTLQKNSDRRIQLNGHDHRLAKFKKQVEEIKEGNQKDLPSTRTRSRNRSGDDSDGWNLIR